MLGALLSVLCPPGCFSSSSLLCTLLDSLRFPWLFYILLVTGALLDAQHPPRSSAALPSIRSTPHCPAPSWSFCPPWLFCAVMATRRPSGASRRLSIHSVISYLLYPPLHLVPLVAIMILVRASLGFLYSAAYFCLVCSRQRHITHCLALS